MRTRTKLLMPSILLALLAAGIWIMGYGLGDDYLATKQWDSSWIVLLGLSVCLLSGLTMAFITPADQDYLGQDHS